MMKKILISGLAVLALAGCGSAAPTADSDERARVDGYTVGLGKDEVYAVTVDGVKCVVYNGVQKGGIDCNWEAYNANH